MLLTGPCDPWEMFHAHIRDKAGCLCLGRFFTLFPLPPASAVVWDGGLCTQVSAVPYVWFCILAWFLGFRCCCFALERVPSFGASKPLRLQSLLAAVMSHQGGGREKFIRLCDLYLWEERYSAMLLCVLSPPYTPYPPSPFPPLTGVQLGSTPFSWLFVFPSLAGKRSDLNFS